MRGVAHFLLVVGILFSVVSADVSELNYFKDGVVDSSGDLIEGANPVSGVGVLGVVCSDSDCSSISSYLWGSGGLYVSGNSITLVYPTTLLSSYGYGVYMYKIGYIPYEVEADWYGTGSVGPYDNFLSRKGFCVSEVKGLDVVVDEGNVDVDVEVESPIIAQYDLKFMPPQILDYHRTLIDVNVEVRDDDGDVVYSKTKQVDPEFSKSDVVSFSFGLDEGDYVSRAYTSLDNEAKCLDYGVDEKFYNFSVVVPCVDADADGICEDVDCDDNDESVWQILNGYTDGDLDFFGVDSAVNVCSGSGLPSGYVDNNLDCDDSDFLVNPDAEEVCWDGVDNDCDGVVDEGCVKDLNISDLVCFDSVVEGHNQSCSVFVEDDFGNKVGGAGVEVYYSDGSLFGSCLSDSISGACSVADLQDEVGSFEVYAVASKSGYDSDDDGDSRFWYDVLEEKYTISDLKVFNDSAFLDEDYDFYRGENLYVSFVVKDLEGCVVQDNFVSGVSLVSSVAGGRIDLVKVMRAGGVYYYKLVPIPVTHDFVGDSNVFAFVFDFEDQSGGQEQTSLVIRNNLPYVNPSIPNQDVKDGESFSIDLGDFENDVEDSGDDLSWAVVSFGDDLNVDLVGKSLFVEGKDVGTAEVVLRLTDLDGDFDEVSFEVEVFSSGDGGSKVRHSGSCKVDWECSLWSDCVGGFSTRSCFDREGCGDENGRPSELKSCEGFVVGTGGAVLFGEGNVVDEGNNFWSYFLIGVLVFLILVLVVLIAMRV